MARAFAPGSIEIAMDWVAIEQDLAKLFMEAKDSLEGSAFATGTGTNQPWGAITAVRATATSLVASGTADELKIGDVYGIETDLPAKYRLATMDGDLMASRATFLAARGAYNLVRAIDTQGGARLWETVGYGLPPTLLGYNAYEASAMDGIINTGSHNYMLILGDFQNYVIYDRIGFNLELIPHMFSTTNNRPSGQRGWFGYWRVGADSVNDDAFRILNVT